MRLAGLVLLAALALPAVAASSAEPVTEPSPVAPAEPVTADSCGWPRKVERQVLTQATRLMPPSLQRLLRRHERALRQGAQDEKRRAPAALHAEDVEPGDGPAERLAASLARISALLDGHAPMHQVAWEMGAASHLVSDLSNPFRTVPRDQQAAAYEARFLSYVEEQLPDLRIVFTSYEHPLLEQGETIAFGRQLAATSRSYLEDLVGSFRRFDDTGDPAYVDQRSIPFGVASLSFSRTVTDTARVWLRAWRQAHGDITGLPYPLSADEDREGDAGKKGTP